MGDRGVAPVIDLEQRRKRGAQVGRGHARRVNPAVRAPRVEMVVDWDAYRRLDRQTVRSIETGGRRPPLKQGRLRRSGRPARNVKGVLSRQARRLAWKIERRTLGKVAWRESSAAQGMLAPVIPLRRRGTLARIRRSLPEGRRSSGRDLMDGAA